MFDRLLSEDRESYAERVERLLTPACAEFKANKCRSEQEVMNLACLIDRTGQERFAGAVFEAAKVFDNNFAFDYSGPWAPTTLSSWTSIPDTGFRRTQCYWSTTFCSFP